MVKNKEVTLLEVSRVTDPKFDPRRRLLVSRTSPTISASGHRSELYGVSITRTAKADYSEQLYGPSPVKQTQGCVLMQRCMAKRLQTRITCLSTPRVVRLSRKLFPPRSSGRPVNEMPSAGARSPSEIRLSATPAAIPFVRLETQDLRAVGGVGWRSGVLVESLLKQSPDSS